MDEIPFELPFMSNIGLVMTYKCQIACPHCIIEAGPHRSEEVSIDDAFKWIQQIAEYKNGRIKVLALTGGEPFYDVNKLKSVSDFAESCGLLVSVVTNAFWASTEEEAIKVLRRVPAIKMISFSTDQYHQKFISIERIRNAVIAAQKCDIPYYISVTTENKSNDEYRQIIEVLNDFVEKDKIVTATTLPVGRALKNLGSLRYETSEDPPVYSCPSSNFPVIFPNGKVTACIGPIIDLPSDHPLLLGDLNKNSLSDILNRAEINPILQAIRVWGPRKLVFMIREQGPKEHLPQCYEKDSICITCYKLMSDKKIVEFLVQASIDFEFIRKVAYARVYYLHETEMIDLLGIDK